MVSKLGFRWPRGAFFYPSADTPTSSRRAGASPLCIVTFSRLSLTSGPILDGVHRQRPGPLWWTWYAFGGKLPDRHGEWVLNDVTCRTWWLRHVARSLVQLAPVAALLLVVLGPGWITYLGLAAGTILALIYSVPTSRRPASTGSASTATRWAPVVRCARAAAVESPTRSITTPPTGRAPDGAQPKPRIVGLINGRPCRSCCWLPLMARLHAGLQLRAFGPVRRSPPETSGPGVGFGAIP